MFKNRAGRAGFTLPEVLVTVAIVAVLAAVVVPAVTQQLGRADAPAFNSSVNSLRTAITSFASDVRQLPGEVSQLQTAITTLDTRLARTADSVGAEYSAAFVARWRGPYESSGISTGALEIGDSWVTADNLIDSTGTGYLVAYLTRTGAVITDAVALDAAVDNGNGATAGFIRWDATDTPDLKPVNTVFLFLMSSAR